MSRLTTLPLVAAAAFLLGAPSAHALVADKGSDASVYGGEVAFLTEPGDNRDDNIGKLSVQSVANEGLFISYEEQRPGFNGAGFTANPPCGKSTPIRGYCPVDANSIVAVSLGDGPDSLNATEAFGFPMVIYGGADKDVISGSPGDDRIEGGTGDDILHGFNGDDVIQDLSFYGGGGGNDEFKGFAGDDFLDAGVGLGASGSDVMEGNENIDTVDYSGRTVPVTVSVGNAKAATQAGRNDGQAGEQDDVSTVEIVFGGSAGDSLTGNGAPNTLEGRKGDDLLSGGGGADTLLGGGSVYASGTGSDRLDGGTGGDLLFGGDGIDTALYASRTQPVTVTIDDAANDGEQGEGDNVTGDMENVDGGAGADKLTGSATANRLRGFGGGDKLTGAGGDDTLEGGGAADTLTGGTGEDVYDGGTGDDTIDARDKGATDTVTCGDGADTVIADPADTVAADCETVDRGAVAGGGTGTGTGTGTGSDTGSDTGNTGGDVGSGTGTGGDTGAGGGGGGTETAEGPQLAIKKAAKVDRRGRARLRVGCPASSTGGCTGSLKLSRRYGRASFVITAGKTKTVRVKLSKKARRTIRRRKRLKVTVTAIARGAAGKDRTTRVRVTLKRLR